MQLLFMFLRVVRFFLHGKPYILLSLLASFFLSVWIARLFGTYSLWNLRIGGFHIHHFYSGIVLVCLSSLILLILQPGKNPDRLKVWAARIAGVGMGLIADEIGLLLTCTTENFICDYAYGDLNSTISLAFWLLIILIILVEVPHDIRVKMKNRLDRHLAAQQKNL